eukprot:gene8301-10564_t
MAKKKPEPGFDSLLEKARRFCLFRERSRYETEQKIRSWGIPYAIQEKLMKALEEEKFINDSRFAEVYARSKFNSNHWGKTKIKAYLSEMRISRSDIQHALNQISDEAYETSIRALAEKKAATLKPEDDTFTKRVKLSNYLLQKGYEYGAIKSIIEKLVF